MRIACALWFVLLSGLVMAQNTTKTVAERLGYPADSRLLVIHADDFGMSHSVNQATMQALEKHWVTSASIMVPCPWFTEVAEWAKSHHDADLGIHLTLNSEWNSYRWPGLTTSPGSSLLDAQGYLPFTTSEVLHNAKAADVQTEARAQVERARQAGITPSHLDTHMGTIVSSPQFFATYIGLGRQLWSSSPAGTATRLHGRRVSARRNPYRQSPHDAARAFEGTVAGSLRENAGFPAAGFISADCPSWIRQRRTARSNSRSSRFWGCVAPKRFRLGRQP